MRKAIVTLALLAVAAASCASAPTTSSNSVSSTTRPPSALHDLTGFFTSANGIDQNLKVAAVDANGAIGTTQIVDHSTDA